MSRCSFFFHIYEYRIIVIPTGQAIKLWWNDWETDVHMICSLLYFFLTDTLAHIKGNKSMTCPVPAHADGGYTQAQQISVMRLPAEQQVQNKDTYRSMLWGSTSRATATNRRLVYILPSCVYCRPWQAYSERNWTALERSCASHSIKKSIHQYIYCLYMYATTELSATMVL